MGTATAVTRPSHTMFTAANGAGACVLPSAQIGDRVLAVVNIGTGGIETSSFESTISKNNQIQQASPSNLSGNSYYAFCIG
jgi:hypothetical protein